MCKGLGGAGQEGQPYLVVDGKGGHLHGHGHDVHCAVHQAGLKLLVQVYELLLPAGMLGSAPPPPRPLTSAHAGEAGDSYHMPSGLAVHLCPPRGASDWEHSLIGASGLGLPVQEDEAQEVHGELQQHREDGIQVEDVGQGPLPGQGLEGLWGLGMGQACLPTATGPSWEDFSTAVTQLGAGRGLLPCTACSS